MSYRIERETFDRKLDNVLIDSKLFILSLSSQFLQALVTKD